MNYNKSFNYSKLSSLTAFSKHGFVSGTLKIRLVLGRKTNYKSHCEYHSCLLFLTSLALTLKSAVDYTCMQLSNQTSTEPHKGGVFLEHQDWRLTYKYKREHLKSVFRANRLLKGLQLFMTLVGKCVLFIICKCLPLQGYVNAEIVLMCQSCEGARVVGLNVRAQPETVGVRIALAHYC